MAPMLGCRCWKAGRLRWVSSIFLTPVWRPRERVNTKNPILLFASSREEFSRLPPGLSSGISPILNKSPISRGKRLAWDYGGHAINQTWQNAVMETAGLKATDVVQVRVSNLNDGVRAVPEGKVDAAFTAVGIGVVEEANAMEPIRFLSMPNTDTANKIMDRYGAAVVKSTPGAGIKGDTHVIGYPLQLVSSSKVNEKTIYTLVKVWWDNLAELQTIHPLFKRWTKETQALTNFTVPYHPGAIQFYKEAGVWTAKHDARLKEICK